MTNGIHWSKKKEHGAGLWQFRFFSWVVRTCPGVIMNAIVAVVTFFFFLGAKEDRRLSAMYLAKLSKVSATGLPKPTFFAVYKHMFSFALSMVEKIACWKDGGALSKVELQNDDIDALVNQLNEGKGACLICSHLGNMETLRALTGVKKTHASRSFKVIPVIDFSGTAKFNEILKQLNPTLMTEIVDANSVGTDTVIWMQGEIEKGNLVVIAGDRTSTHTMNRTVAVPFLGELAYFPLGTFLLTSIIGAPIYYAFALRKRDLNIQSPCEMHIQKAKVETCGTRKERTNRVQNMVFEYAETLEKHCVEHPYQWYNFFEFWTKPVLSGLLPETTNQEAK